MCQSKSLQNCTYIANSGYPSTVSGVNSCAYTISYCNDNICQLRLDFENLVLTQGTNGDVASSNRLTVDGPTSQDPPSISGTNTGKHSKNPFQSTGTRSILIRTIYTQCMWRLADLQQQPVSRSQPSPDLPLNLGM